MLCAVGVASVALAGLAVPSHATGQDEDWEAARMPARTARAYAVVGDSITSGIGTSDPATRAYPVVAGVQGVGVGGACASAAHCPYPALPVWLETAVFGFEHRPSTVVALIGINDIVNGDVASEVVLALKRLRRQARAMDVRLVFGTLTPTVRHVGWSYIQTVRTRVNRWIRRQPVFVDYARAVENRRGWLDQAYSADGLHLNDAGEQVMAATLVDWIVTDAARRH